MRKICIRGLPMTPMKQWAVHKYESYNNFLNIKLIAVDLIAVFFLDIAFKGIGKQISFQLMPHQWRYELPVTTTLTKFVVVLELLETGIHNKAGIVDTSKICFNVAVDLSKASFISLVYTAKSTKKVISWWDFWKIQIAQNKNQRQIGTRPWNNPSGKNVMTLSL